MRRTAALAVAVVFLADSFLIPLAQAEQASQLWQQRRQAASSAATGDQYASLPAVLNAPLPAPSALRFSSTRVPAASSPDVFRLIAALPATAGDVRAVNRRDGAHATVVHIQDIHANDEAQENIRVALASLVDKAHVPLVAVEGAFEPIDLSRLRAYPKKATIRRVADYLLAQHLISGAVRAGLDSESSARFVGIDNAGLHEENRRAYVEAAPSADAVKVDIERARRRVAAEKAKLFSADLARFDATVEAYRAGQTAITDYVPQLFRFTEDISPRLHTFMAAAEIEARMDFARVEADRSRVLAHLVSVLSADQLADLLRKGTAYRAGGMRHAEFYGYLNTLCCGKGMDLKMYPAMDDYIHYVLLSDSVDATRLLQDVDSAERAVYAKLATDPAQRALLDASERLHLAGKLLTFSLTNDDWRRFQQLSGVQLAEVSAAALEKFEGFYRAADKRDETMADRFAEELERSKASTAVLVTGGFHSRGIEERLARRGIQVVTFVPSLTKVDDAGGSYLSVFAREHTSLDRLFEGPKLFLSPNPAQFNTAPVLTAAIDHIDGPQRVVTTLAPGTPLTVELVNADDGVTTLDVTNNANGSTGRVTVRYDEDAIENVTEVESARGRLVSSVRERFRLSATTRFRIFSLLSVPINIGLGALEFVRAPRFIRRAILTAFAGLFLFNATSQTLAQTSLPPSNPAAAARRAQPPGLPPILAQGAPAKAPVAKVATKANPQVANARQRREALRVLRQDLAAARTDDARKIADANSAVGKIKKALKRLTRNVNERKEALRTAQSTLDDLEKQLAETRKRLNERVYKTPPILELHAAAQALAKTDWGKLADDVADMRATAQASKALGTGAGEAITARFDQAENALRALATAAEDLKALDARGGAAMTPEESAATATRLSEISEIIDAAADVPTLIGEAQAALGLNAVPVDLSAPASRVSAATNPDALKAASGPLGVLSAAMVNLDSLRSESAELARHARGLEIQIDRVQGRVSSLQSARYYNLETKKLAQQIDAMVNPHTFVQLATEAQARLEALPTNQDVTPNAPDPTPTWRANLSLIWTALENLKIAQAQLGDDTLTPEEHVKALNAAVRSIYEIRRAQAAFNPTTNPNYGDEVGNLPKSVNALRRHPAALSSFEAFRAASAANGKLSEESAIAQWYGQFIVHDIGTGFPTVNLESLLVTAEAAITNGLNLHSQAEQSANAADREEARRDSTRDEAARMVKERESLERLRRDISRDAERAGKLAPTVKVITPNFRPDTDRMDRVARSIDAVLALPIKFIGNDGKSLHDLMFQVRNDARRLADGTLTDSEAASARERLSTFIQSLDNIVNPAVVQYGDSDVDALRVMMTETVNSGIVWLAGISEERLRAGVTSGDTYEDRLIRAAPAIFGAPGEAIGARKNLAQLKKNEKWGAFDILEAVNTFMGVLNLHQNFDTFMGKKNPFSFIVERAGAPFEPLIREEKSSLPAAGGPVLLLGSANAYVGANGAVTELRLALTSEAPERAIPYFVSTLFPEAFNHREWEILGPSAKDESGYVYYRTVGFAIRTKLENKNEKKLKWVAVADASAALNRLYRVRNGVVEVMATGADRADLEARVNHLVRAVQAINGVIAFTRGLKANLVSPTPNAFARFNGAMAVINTVSGIVDLIEKAKYKSTLRSEYGGWVTSPTPNFSAEMTLVYPDGTRVRMGALRDNGALLVRRDNVWETPDGTPIYRLGQGRVKIALNILRLRLRIWRSAERFQESTRVAGQAATLATAQEGVFSRRRPDSAPVTVVADGGQLFLQTNVFGVAKRFVLGVPDHDVPVDGHLVTARPFYAVGNDNEPGALMGVLIGDVPLRPGDTVSYKSIFAYLGSLPQKMNGMLVQMGVEGWYELNPVEARFAKPGIPAFPGVGWRSDIDGVENFMGKNSFGDRTVLFLRWTSEDGTFVLDLEKQVLYRFSVDSNGTSVLTGVLGTSLPGLALSKEREQAKIQWTPVPSGSRSRLPTDISLRVPGNNVSAWIDPVSNDMFVNITQANTTVDGVLFQAAGIYRSRLGGLGARQADEAITHPFYRRQPLPLSATFDKSAALQNTRQRADGTTETWYAVSQLVENAKPGEKREEAGVYVEYTEGGSRRMDRVVASLPGVRYEASVAGLPSDWAIRLVLPNDLTWTNGDIPASVAAFAPEGAQAQFALDDRGRPYLRLNMPDGRVFGFAAGASPAQLRANADAIEKRETAEIPLPDGIPDAVMRPKGGAPNASVVKVNGRWVVRLQTVKGAESRIEQLTNGRVVAVENKPINDLIAEFHTQGLDLRAGGTPVPFGGLSVTPYLAFAPGNPVPVKVALLVEADGEFASPDLLPNQPPVSTPVKKDTILLIELGRLPTLARLTRQDSPRPFLDRVFLSRTAIGALSAEPLVDLGEGSLPAVFGRGAETVRGRWVARQPMKNGRRQTTELYFEVTTGGTVVDPMTNGTTRFESGTMWVVERTAAGADAFVTFNAGRQPGWTVRMSGEAIAGRGIPFALPGINGTVPGRFVSVPGGAPLFVVELPAGETREVADAFMGNVPVANGDVLVFQWPAGFQRASVDAQARAERLFVPSIVGRSAIAADYLSQPSPDKTPRTLVRGAARAGLLPGFPADVDVDVWVDPNHSDAPMIIEVVSVPQGGRTWVHPQLGTTVPLSVGTTFVRVSTLVEMEREIALLNDSKRPYLAETPWDLSSTTLNGRHAFDARTDVAAKWRRANNHADQWSFVTRVGGLRARVIEDMGNPNSSYFSPAMDIVVFFEAGVVNGVHVVPGIVYRRNASLPVAEARVERLERHWGAGYPAANAGDETNPIVFDRPILTGRRYLHATRPFFEDGRPNLVNRGTPDRAVQVVRRNGVIYVVEGRPPTGDSKALVFNLDNGIGSEVHTKNFNSPQFSGLTQVRYLGWFARQRLAWRARALTGGLFDLSNDMLVRLNEKGQPTALVILGEPGVAWVTARQNGLGMVQLDAGSHNARLEGTNSRRSYAGWIGIGREPGFLSLEQVQANILPANGVDGAKGWILVNEKSQRIGIVIFGDAAPKEPVGGLAAIYDLKTRAGRVVTGDRYDVPDFSGLSRVDALTGRQRAELRDLMLGTAAGRRAPHPGMLVRLDQNGHPVAVVVPRVAAREWTARQIRGYGYLQMDAGSHDVELNGATGRRSLNGWVSIGNGRNQLTPQQIARNLAPANGRDEKKGWIVVDKSGRRIGFFVEGKRPLPARPDFLVHLPPRAASSAVAAPGAIVALTTEDLTDAIKKQLRPVVEARVNGRPVGFVWAAYIGGAWRQFRPVPGRPGDFYADASGPALVVTDSPTPDIHPRGLVDDNGKVTAIVSSGGKATKEKTKAAKPPSASGPWTVQRVEFRGRDNSSHVTIHNPRSNETAIDSYFSEHVAFRTYQLEDRGGRMVTVSRVVYDFHDNHNFSISKQDPDPAAATGWRAVETYTTNRNQTFIYPARSPNAGMRVKGDVLTAFEPNTNKIKSKTFYAADDGRVIWTEVEFNQTSDKPDEGGMFTVQFYGPDGRAIGQWTYDLSPAVDRLDRQRPPTRNRGGLRRGSGLNSLSPTRVALLPPSDSPPSAGAGFRLATPPPAPPASSADEARATARINGDVKPSPFESLLATLGLSGILGIVVTKKRRGDGSGNGNNRGGSSRGDDNEDKLALRVVRSLRLISELPGEGPVDDDQRAQALSALEDVFEGAPLDQGLASVDGRAGALLNAFGGVRVNGQKFREAFRREMGSQFGREIPLDEALNLAHTISVLGAEMAPMAEVLPAEFGDGAAAIVVVTESMRPRLRDLVAAVPAARNGRRVIFVAENEDLRGAIAAAAGTRSDMIAVNGAAAFAGSADERTRRLRLDGLEDILAASLAPDFFSTVSALTLISPDGLPIDTEFATNDVGVLRDLLRQAVVILINEQLQAASMSFGTLETIGALARVISSQA